MRGAEQKYRIIDKLDSGGMAEIYRAEAELMPGMKKKVAIKRILPHLTQNETFVAMFLDEAKLSLYLDHANIVHVFDIGRSGSTYFIVMEYVDGMNLRALTDSLRRQRIRLELSHSLFVSMEICKGLGYAHDMRNPEDDRPLGIVHRDISPPNVLLSRNGEVKLADFGLAKAASQVETTDPGIVKGKFSYLSPEAASGQPVDFRADIFACGIVLFEMLTGRRLFYGETDYQTVELVRQTHIPALASLNPQAPAELEAVVRRALARDPDQRFQHAYELQDALAQILFDRGMKVTSRDLAKIVRRCIEEQRNTVPADVGGGGVIDTLIQEEVLKFTSLDAPDPKDAGAGATPLSPEDLGEGGGPLDPRDFIDPRDWTNDFGGEATRRTPQGGAATKIPEVTSLERMLEGDAPPTPQRPKQVKRHSHGRGLWLVLLLCAAVGAATVLLLNSLGILDTKTAIETLP